MSEGNMSGDYILGEISGSRLITQALINTRVTGLRRQKQTCKERRNCPDIPTSSISYRGSDILGLKSLQY